LQRLYRYLGHRIAICIVNAPRYSAIWNHDDSNVLHELSGIDRDRPALLISGARYLDLITASRKITELESAVITCGHDDAFTRAAAPHLNDRSNDGLRSSNLNDSPRNRCRSRLLHEQRKSENAE